MHSLSLLLSSYITLFEFCFCDEMGDIDSHFIEGLSGGLRSRVGAYDIFNSINSVFIGISKSLLVNRNNLYQQRNSDIYLGNQGE